MEEQKRENKEELQQETAEEKNSGQGNSSTRSSLLWIFAGGYLVYTGYRLCASVISGAEDSGVVFLAAGLYKRLMVFIQSSKSHTYKSGKEHQPDSPNSVYIEGEGNRYGQQAVFCHVSSLTDIKFDTCSFLGKLFQAFAGS